VGDRQPMERSHLSPSCEALVGGVKVAEADIGAMLAPRESESE